MIKIIDGFTAKKVNFQGTEGYMICQYIDGEKVVEQFAPSESYEFFCKIVKIAPLLISE